MEDSAKMATDSGVSNLKELRRLAYQYVRVRGVAGSVSTEAGRRRTRKRQGLKHQGGAWEIPAGTIHRRIYVNT